MIVPGSASPLLASAGGYNLTKSLRFRSGASARLTRTPASASNRKTYTISAWVKLGSNPSSNIGTIFCGGDSSTSTSTHVYFYLDQIRFYWGGAGGPEWRTTQVFRDYSAWYHLVFAVDTNQATLDDKLKLYVNGVRFNSWVSQNSIGAIDTQINNTVPHALGSNAATAQYLYDGYMAEFNFIDGQQLTPSSFGQTSSSTGVWTPKKYVGTYGTNGFYLPFTNTASTSTLGNDFSGNSNNFTVNGISLTTGSTYDSMTDVPTLTSATAANYATFNPLAKGSATTLSDGNLKYSSNASSGVNGIVSMYITTGMKTYFEITCGAAALYRNIQIGDAYYVGDSGSISGGTGGTGTFATWTTGDVVRFACDYNAGTIACYKNNTLQTTLTGVTNTSPWIINPGQAVGLGEYTANFGQQPFAFSVPSGFSGLNTFNLPTPTIGATASTTANKYFNAITYTGNGAASSNTTQNITTTFYPDLTWVKGRDSAFYHRLTSTGLTQPNYLSTNSTDAEGSVNDQISALASTYFQVKASGTGGTNQSGSTYVGWTWNANSGSTVTNTAGSITSTVSANTTAGFSIVTYTGNGTAGATVGHGLGVAPDFIILKNKASSNWWVYPRAMQATYSGEWLYLNFNFSHQGTASANDAPFYKTNPTSTVFYVAGDGANTSSNNYVAYCFAQVAGYSAFGTYTGNNDDNGPFIYTGFRPRWVMVKNTTSAQSWQLMDTSRSTYNVATANLLPNSPTQELTGTDFIDILSNGFKIRRNSVGNWNNSGDTYLYVCFAENPFKYANAR